ncbi:hypothetical protein BH23PLA1_BH23PLA1_38190 [soil metagenome]
MSVTTHPQTSSRLSTLQASWMSVQALPQRLLAGRWPIVVALLAGAPVLAMLDPVLGPSGLLVATAAMARIAGFLPGLLMALVSALAILLVPSMVGPAFGIAPMGFARAVSVFLIGYLLVLYVSRQSRTSARLRRSEHWGRLVVETAREGVWAVDDCWRTTYVSPRLEEMLGLETRILLGEDLRDFLYSPDRRIETMLDPARQATEQAMTCEVRFRHADGTRINARVSAQPIESDQNSTAAGLLLMVEEISELKASNQERDETLREMAEIRLMHDRLVESNVIGIITADLGGEIVEANDAFLQIVGHTRSDLLRGHLRLPDLIPPDQQALDVARAKSLWARGAWPPHEIELIRKDGTRIPVLFGAAALERVPRHWVGFVLDLSEQKQTQAELKQAKDRAESADLAKDRFLAKLSHELRTPLNPVLATATALLDDPATDSSIHDFLEMVRRNVELEARLIDDLLDVTRVRYGKLHLERQTVDAHTLIHQTLEICAEDLRAGPLRLELDLAADSHHIEADPIRLQQVFWNLIKNAVKFTPEGGTLSIRSWNADEGGQWVVEFRDTGLGIDPNDVDRIFNAFEQARAASGRRPGGLGLGLSISHSVIEAHGGTLLAHSQGAGKGSVFTIHLATVAPSPIKDQDASASSTDRPDQAPLTILLVEDNHDTLRYMNLLLSRRGHTIRTASSLRQACEAASNGPIDLVISDIELPDGTGLELLRSLQDQGVHPTSAIALSGFGSADDIEMSLEAGFAEHLTKPIDFRRLEAAIYRVTSASVAASTVEPVE